MSLPPFKEQGEGHLATKPEPPNLSIVTLSQYISMTYQICSLGSPIPFEQHTLQVPWKVELFYPVYPLISPQPSAVAVFWFGIHVRKGAGVLLGLHQLGGHPFPLKHCLAIAFLLLSAAFAVLVGLLCRTNNRNQAKIRIALRRSACPDKERGGRSYRIPEFSFGVCKKPSIEFDPIC